MKTHHKGPSNSQADTQRAKKNNNNKMQAMNLKRHWLFENSQVASSSENRETEMIITRVKEINKANNQFFPLV